MLGISDHSQRLKVAEGVVHQQVLLAEKMGCKHQNMAWLLRRDWKPVGMAKETMNDLIGRLQPFVTALNKTLGFRLSTLSAINKYWG